LSGPTLVVLAAGLGARFGGAKQFFELGPSGETFADYSLYEAWRAGFARALFIVREENQDLVAHRYKKNWAGRMTVDSAVQRMDDLPARLSLPAARHKPWGTAHALWCARKRLKEPFCVVNADDFYGQEAFAAARQALESAPDDAALVSYPVGETLSAWGGVARALCRSDAQGWLQEIVECRSVRHDGERIVSDEHPELRLEGNAPVSMNFWAFPARAPRLFEPSLRRLALAAREASTTQPQAELTIAEAVAECLRAQTLRARVLREGAGWFGFTYREDAAPAAERLRALARDGGYPTPLWSAAPQSCGSEAP